MNLLLNLEFERELRKENDSLTENNSTLIEENEEKNGLIELLQERVNSIEMLYSTETAKIKLNLRKLISIQKETSDIMSGMADESKVSYYNFGHFNPRFSRMSMSYTSFV